MPADRSPAPAATTPRSPHPHAPKAQDFAAQRDWPGYFRAVAGKPPRQTLLDALQFFDAEAAADAGAAAGSGVSKGRAAPARLALDLGCGEGRDTAELLARGWTVAAVDTTPEAFVHLLERVPREAAQRVLAVRGSFFDEAVEWPQSPALVNASYSLPFCPPDRFDGMWARIIRTIPRGGRFCGQLFGDRDGWQSAPDMSFHPRRDLDRLFSEFILDSLREVENDEPTAMGDMKHWHLYHIVARKR